MNQPTSLDLERHQLISDIDAYFKQDTPHKCVLAIIDIRDFRELNHSFGINFGDQVLAEIHQRLHNLMLANTAYYYLGNDEFAILLTNPASPGMALMSIENILSVFRDPFKHEKNSIKVTVNCGLVNNFDQHKNTSQLLFDAEVALKQAKSSNQPYIWLDQQKQQTSSRSKWTLLNSLHQAIADEELSLYWQPKIPLQACTVNQPTIEAPAELLIRWETADQGVLAPKITLPLIEHLGSEIELIEWMLNTALKQLSIADQELNLISKGDTPPNLLLPTVSINVPPSMETINALEKLVANAIEIWDIEASRITLEMTEEILISDKQSVIEKLNSVRQHGVKISIDDFGTGYSSLAYFKHIPADELKIDQGFIHSMRHSESDRKIVSLIIDIAQTFNLRVVAEGVEDESTANLLKEMGCDYAQGFLYSKPLPPNDYLQWLQGNKNLYIKPKYRKA